jgi:hypothetical protein
MPHPLKTFIRRPGLRPGHDVSDGRGVLLSW